MGPKPQPKLPDKYKDGGLWGHKPVEPAAGNTSDSIVAVDGDPDVDDVDGAGPTEAAETYKTRSIQATIREFR